MARTNTIKIKMSKRKTLLVMKIKRPKQGWMVSGKTRDSSIESYLAT
jgi:hypothetical protein